MRRAQGFVEDDSLESPLLSPNLTCLSRTVHGHHRWTKMGKEARSRVAPSFAMAWMVNSCQAGESFVVSIVTIQPASPLLATSGYAFATSGLGSPVEQLATKVLST